MRSQFGAATMVMLAVLSAGAQIASHAPTHGTSPASEALPPAKMATLEVTGKTVARVNGAALSDRDLVREMFAIFPYANQHNGFPEKLEPQIRKGALEMIIFEELVYQEAKHRRMTVPPERMAKAERQFRWQFPDEKTYQQFLKVEVNGSQEALRDKVRRSLLIEDLLTAEVVNKSRVPLAQAKAFYDNNPAKFERGELFHIQSISIVPPVNASTDVLKEARRRADDVAQQAKAATTYRDFGLLAEKLSDDDYRVNMGDHKPCGRDKLPPEIVKAASAMKPGQISELIQMGKAYTVFRLEAHTLAGKIPFAEVKGKLQSDLQKEKVEQLRSSLGRRLRKNAKIEML